MADQPTNTIVTQQRVVRVFISSTFRDMHAEREELVKRVFPQLRKLCETRGVTWGEVDLRWGVTDEQKAEGKVLPICLSEIHNCRPYFIGILGERYGWIPEEIPQKLVEENSWLSEHRERSVTELEILHGVLNNPAMAGHAFFYFRSPSFVESLPADVQPAYREACTSEEIAQFGDDEANRRAGERKRKLAALKDRIRISGFPVREDFTDASALGQLVLEDLTHVVEQVFPQDRIPDPLEREAVEHQAFARSRANVYIGRPDYFDKLDAHVAGNGPPLVVVGESGSGKSALLANWAMHQAESDSFESPLMHFIGATPYSADWTAMLARLLGEINRRFDLPRDIPEEPNALRRAFANCLGAAAARGKLIIILDALDQLEDHGGAPDLAWLPLDVPANVRLIMSTLPGRARDEVAKRQWPVLTVAPLQPDERGQLLREYLAQFRKTLDAASIERIKSAEQAASPLYLRQLLEELRLHGDYFTVAKRLEHYLTAQNAADLFAHVLERYETDYERERPGLVRDAMSHLWAARRGLSEAELLDLLGTQGKALPHAFFSPLHLAIEQSLVVRSGLIGFFHRHLREAVRERYLAGEQEQTDAHLRLARYFERRDLDVRKREELPWQLARAGVWESLSALLTDPSFFEAIWRANPSELQSYWAQIEANSPIRMRTAYQPLLSSQESDVDYVKHVAFLFRQVGHLDEAESLQRSLLARGRDKGDVQSHLTGMANLAAVLHGKGDLRGALAIYDEMEQMVGQIGSFDELSMARHLGNKASVLIQLGSSDDDVLSVRSEEERLFRKNGDLPGLARSLVAQVQILVRKNMLSEAAARCAEAELISRQLGDQMLLATALVERSDVFEAQRDTASALAVLDRSIEISRETGYMSGIYGGQFRRAQLLLSKHGSNEADRDEARKALVEAEHACRRTTDSNLRLALYQHAKLLSGEGSFDDALEKLGEAEQLCLAIKDSGWLASVIDAQAEVLAAQGNEDAALARRKEAQVRLRDLGREDDLAENLRAQVGLVMRRDMDSAMDLMREAEDIYRRTGKKEELKQFLFVRAAHLKSKDRYEETEEILLEHDELCKELGDETGLKASREIRDSIEASRLCVSAVAMATQGQRERALPLFQRAVELAPDYGTCWSDMGICLLEMNRLAEAEAAMTKASGLIPNDVLNWSKLGKTRLLQLKMAEAQECLDRCRSLSPTDQWTVLLAAMVEAVKNAKPAKQAPWWKIWN